MKLVRFSYKGEIFGGRIEEDEIVVKAGESGFRKININEVKLLAPVEPSKIVSVGLNYKDHAEELGMAIPSEPILFLKPSTAVIGPGDNIIYPGVTNRMDYEAELAVVIKDRIHNISKDRAFSHIAGYTCFNDVTSRDLQKKDIQWSRAKSFDTFAPMGPWIETNLDPSDLRIRSYVNGNLKQNSRTSEFIFNIPELIEFISGVMTLLPGDIITTGTPKGIGALNPGDEVTIEIEGIGRLTNQVKSFA
ncbi:MAG: fumarylacetoacetate hydrolase family protein [Candidatus Omnitrophota bacterium]